MARLHPPPATDGPATSATFYKWFELQLARSLSL